MLYVLVKFYGQEPTLMGCSNMMHPAKMATMEEVEWVTPAISPSGYVLEVDQLIQEGTLGKRIQPYRGEAHEDLRGPRERRVNP